MSRRRRPPLEVFGLAFLDVICCGFGAVLLLLVISRTGGAPEPVEPTDDMITLRQSLFELNGLLDEKLQQQQALSQTQASQAQTISAKQVSLQRLDRDLQAANDILATLKVASNQTAAARMELDARLQQISPTSREEVGGIPVDSDYVIFVIDTSGSMQQIWPRVRAEVESILNIHPKVQGIQIMNDMGEYMFAERGARWIPDTEATRRSIQRQMVDWTAFSNSSPVEGIRKAIADFYSPTRNIGIYVLGDEFSGERTEPVLESIRAINIDRASGGKKVRIHGIGFKTMNGPTVRNFAKLMRQVAAENDGTFLALE